MQSSLNLETESDWYCPSCGIYESALLNDVKDTCKPDFKPIHVHHDHLGDFTKKWFAKIYPELDTKDIDFGRFPPTKVCAFCNNLESDLKRWKNQYWDIIHPNFSFSPEEMSKFLIRSAIEYGDDDVHSNLSIAKKIYDNWIEFDGVWQYAVDVVQRIQPQHPKRLGWNDRIPIARELAFSIESEFPIGHWRMKYRMTANRSTVASRSLIPLKDRLFWR